MLFIGHTPTEKHSFSHIQHLTETLVIAGDFVLGRHDSQRLFLLGPVGPGKVALYWVCLNRESISFAFLPVGPNSRGTACMCFSLHLSDTNQNKVDGSRQNQELFVCPTTSFRTRHGLCRLTRNTHDEGFLLPSNRTRPRRHP